MPALPDDLRTISRALIRARLRALSQQNRLIARGEPAALDRTDAHPSA